MAVDRDADTSLTLLERLKKNPDDPQSWNVFIERYQPRIRTWCLAWGLQDSDADDVVQEVLIKLFAALRKFQYDPSGSFRAWLKTVTQHVWIDFVRTRRRTPAQNSGRIDTVADSVDAQADLERHLEEAFEHELFAIAMRKVNERTNPAHWTAFYKTAILGLSGADVARELNMPVGTVFVAKHRVRKALEEEVKVLKNDCP
jgi:RNA polymerase sigma-70 factor (ECF subfamily)